MQSTSASIRSHALFLAVAGALSLAACGPSGADRAKMAKQGATEVGVVVASAEAVPLTVELAGRTSAYLVAEVRPQVSGIVKARLFEEGAMVRAGQPLYQIEPATYQATLSTAQAGLAQARATLTAAKLKADRYRNLVTINAISRQENDDAQASYQAAAANVTAQAAVVQQGRIGVDRTRVTAPISGRIGKSSVTPGALVTESQATPLATIQRLDQIYVDVTQSASDMLKLRRQLASGALGSVGAPQVRLLLEDGSAYPLTGKLEFLDVTVSQSTGSVALRAVFPNPDGVLLPGMYVRATLTTGIQPNGILIPQQAVSRTPNGDATVYVVAANNEPETRVLSVGRTVGDAWLVTAGLRPGERVIVEGLQRVRPGMSVRATVIKPSVVTASATADAVEQR